MLKKSLIWNVLLTWTQITIWSIFVKYKPRKRRPKLVSKSAFLEIFIITGLKCDAILSVVDRNVAIPDTRWRVDVKRWGFIIPRWNLLGLFTWCKGNSKMYWIPGNSRNILEFLQRPEVTGPYKEIPPLYLKKKFTGYCREFKGKWKN